MFSKSRDQVYELTIPNGTAAGATVEATLNLYADYERCIGYAVQSVKNASSEAYSVAIELVGGEGIQDFVHYQHLIPGSGCPQSDRLYKTDFVSKNVQIRVKAKMIVAATSEIIGQFIFKQIR